MTELAPALVAALFAGLLGSAHCLGMCAGISGMVAVNSGVKALATQLPLAFAYNIGRVLSYSILGALVAYAGSAFVAAIPVVAGPFRLISGVIIVLIGVQLAFRWRLLEFVERGGLLLWSGIAPLAKRLLPATTTPRAFGLGILWGWLPCGLVYSALLIAAASANSLDGAVIMAAFGIGTMPAMIMTGIGALRLSQLFGQAGARRAAGFLIVALGLLTLAMPAQHWLGGGGASEPHTHGSVRHHLLLPANATSLAPPREIAGVLP
jgi:sulfite exporter TauE/SafE